MPRFTENDNIAFNSISNKDKAEMLYLYLLGTRKYNMNEVAYHALRKTDDQAGQIVSVVTRGYGFEGQNPCIYSSLYNKLRGSSNYQAEDIENFKRQDIYNFVQANPRGGRATPKDMKAYLESCIAKRLASAGGYNTGSAAPQQTYRQPTPQPQQEVISPHISFSEPITGRSSGGYTRGFSTPRLPSFEWGTVAKVAIGIAAFALVIFLLSKVTSVFSGIFDGISGLFGGSSSVNVNIDVAYFTDGSFDEVMIVVDDQYYNYLYENSNNKFAAELKKGEHSFCVEYYRNGVFYTTDSLGFQVKEKDDLVDLLVYPYGEVLILAFAGS